uniref:Uncharacterized protein n=1 Tax=viral metagenome TaxID=1070528 RepID=A0A6C0B5J2_9ZZZZ
MFQKNAKTPNKPRDAYTNKLIYIPESKQKINSDISEHQYFHNFIEPNYSISSQFDIRSRDDKRFQTRVDLLLERETNMRQGTFNPLHYKQHIKNNNPQNQLQDRPSLEDFTNQQNHNISYPQTPADRNNKPKQYMNVNNPSYMVQDNRMTFPAVHTTNLNNIYYKNNKESTLTPIIKYNNTLFTNKEKNIICTYKLLQNDIDPLSLLNNEAYTIGSLFNKYKSLSTIYSPQNPLHSNIAKTLQHLILIINNSVH